MHTSRASPGQRLPDGAFDEELEGGGLNRGEVKALLEVLLLPKLAKPLLAGCCGGGLGGKDAATLFLGFEGNGEEAGGGGLLMVRGLLLRELKAEAGLGAELKPLCRAGWITAGAPLLLLLFLLPLFFLGLALRLLCCRGLAAG